MLARRLLLFALVLLAVSALSAALAPSRSERDDGAVAVAVDPTVAAGEGSTLVERELDAARVKPRTIRIREGDTLSLEVRAEDVDAVEIEGLSVVEAVGPGSPLTLSVFASEPGDYPIVLLDDERQIGTLVITARDR